jgi:hypothetical protein
VTAITVAYADPPYVGQAKRHYKDQPDYAGEVDHAVLIADLERDYPDGWALSASSPSLRYLLPLCPETVRILVWVKPFAAYKRNVRVGYCWEPIIVQMPERRLVAHTSRDFYAESITMRKGLSGAKPERLAWWLFTAMGLGPGDTLVDLFPGTGAVSRAWEAWQAAGCPKQSQTVRAEHVVHAEEAVA